MTVNITAAKLDGASVVRTWLWKRELSKIKSWPLEKTKQEQMQLQNLRNHEWYALQSRYQMSPSLKKKITTVNSFGIQHFNNLDIFMTIQTLTEDQLPLRKPPTTTTHYIQWCLTFEHILILLLFLKLCCFSFSFVQQTLWYQSNLQQSGTFQCLKGFWLTSSEYTDRQIDGQTY